MSIDNKQATLSALTAEAGKGEEYAGRVLDRFVKIIIEEQPEGVEWTKDQRVHAMRRALFDAQPEPGLYHAVNRMMAALGSDGEISTRHPASVEVMRVLAEMDGGQYTALSTATPAGECLTFTDATIDKLQDVMALHGFAVPVRVISDAFGTAMLAASPRGAGEG